MSTYTITSQAPVKTVKIKTADGQTLIVNENDAHLYAHTAPEVPKAKEAKTDAVSQTANEKTPEHKAAEPKAKEDKNAKATN